MVLSKNDHMRGVFHERKLVLVGNGMAGIRTLENILKRTMNDST